MSNYAPPLTQGEAAKLRKACTQADEARKDALQNGKNMTEAFVVWRKVATQGLPVRKR